MEKECRWKTKAAIPSRQLDNPGLSLWGAGESVMRREVVDRKLKVRWARPTDVIKAGTDGVQAFFSQLRGTYMYNVCTSCEPTALPSCGLWGTWSPRLVAP